MKSYEFEMVCKNALIKILKEKYNEDFKTNELHVAWLCKTLQNFKCTICDLRDNERYYECSYNGDNKKLYVDIYNREYNIVVSEEDFSAEEIQITLKEKLFYFT